MTDINLADHTAAEIPDVRFVNLGRLVPSPHNARRYQSDAGIVELCASLSAVGLIHDLRVRESKGGKLEVVAGSRRLKALQTLLKKKGTVKGVKVTKAFQVRVSFQEAQDSDLEVSLAENEARLNMHPADQVLAFHRLHTVEGLTPEAIAERFGVNPMTIRRRIKLACVSPKIMDEFRADKVSLEQMIALALTDDHERQEAAYFEAEQPWQRNASHLRNRLINEHVRGCERLAKFVGRKAYEAAGGLILRDLFSNEKETFWTNRDLAHRLAIAKLQKIAKQYEGLGWKWVDVSLDGQYHAVSRIYPKNGQLTADDLQRVADLTAKGEAIANEWKSWVNPDAQTQADYRAMLQECEAAIEDIHADYAQFDPSEMAYAGVLIQIDRDGKIKVDCGVVTDNDRKALDNLAKRRKKAANTPPEDLDAQPQCEADNEAPALSMAVVEDLTALRSTALSLAVSDRPDIALCIAIHALAKSEFYPTQYSGIVESASEIRSNSPQMRLATVDPDNNQAFDAIIALREVWRVQLPQHQNQLWDWLLEQKQPYLMKLLAFFVSVSVNCWQQRHQDGRRFTHAHQIADAVQLDMKMWWRPSETFFKRVPVAVALQAMGETNANSDLLAAISKVKKSEAIVGALNWLEGKSWLPTVLRPAAPAFAFDHDSKECTYGETKQLIAAE